MALAMMWMCELFNKKGGEKEVWWCDMQLHQDQDSSKQP
jgi:hypothetical protein